MAASELSLFVDIDQGRLVQGFLSTTQAPQPRFVIGDSIPISFRPMTRNWNNGSNPWSDFDLTGKAVRLAIGNPAGSPTSGTFTLEYAGDITSPLWWNASAADIQTALNALSGITTDGGVTVTKSASGVIRVVFNDMLDCTPITADTSSLYPSTGAEIFVAVEGSVSAREIVVIRLESLPAAYAELTDDFPVAGSVVTQVRAGSVGVGAIFTLEFDPVPYSGFYVLSFDGEQTLGIPWDADASTVQAALELISLVGVGNVSVSGELPFFTISGDPSLGGDIGTLTCEDANLIVPKGKKGVLNTNTSGIVELLNGLSQTTAKLEVELLEISDSTTWTVLQADCTVADDVISNTPFSLTGGPVYVTLETLEFLLSEIDGGTP